MFLLRPSAPLSLSTTVTGAFGKGAKPPLQSDQKDSLLFTWFLLSHLCRFMLPVPSACRPTCCRHSATTLVLTPTSAWTILAHLSTPTGLAAAATSRLAPTTPKGCLLAGRPEHSFSVLLAAIFFPHFLGGVETFFLWSVLTQIKKKKAGCHQSTTQAHVHS